MCGAQVALTRAGMLLVLVGQERSVLLSAACSGKCLLALCSMRRSWEGALEMLPTFCLHPAAPVSCACRVRATSDPWFLWQGAAAGEGGDIVILYSVSLFGFLPEDGFALFY